MKKILTFTILALLVTGAVAPTMAISYWAGDADGTCMGHYVLVDWVGVLYSTSFDGYWGGEPDNDMDAEDVVIDGIFHRVYRNHPSYDPGYWNSGGELFNASGTWWGWFCESLDTCDGDWDGDGCTGGDWWGTEQ